MIKNKEFIFWCAFVFLSGISAVLSYKYFDKVAPMVQLSITADRQQVIDDTLRVASEMNWDVTGYQTSVEFDADDTLQSFVELEGGGKKAFANMFQSEAHYPYLWKVRLFKEQEIVEMRVTFTPEGKRVGFAQKVSEKAPGVALSKIEAQAIIEKNIRAWCQQFEKYALVEYDSENQETGRIDHTFVYERTDISVGKGLYRFNAKVCGNILTKLEPFVKVPEEFIRRYQEMRSANKLIGTISSFLIKFIYIFIFGLFGLLYFYRRNYLLIRFSFVVSFFIAAVQILRDFNDYPLWWISYNTIQSSSNFIMLKSLECFIGFLVLLGFTFITLLIAEAAGRYVYKNHIQFFKILDWQVLSSTELFKQVAIGYLWMPFELGYVVLFLYISETYFGWWSPSFSLSDPNVIASYFPWFGSISMALQAGFTEEVLCRALPLAMTAVLTRNSKHKGWWFAGIFVLQAFIFGGGHAGYPNQPSYARIVELIIPSFNFAFLYYRFGLIPGVISHFVYDAVLMALPVFVSNLLWSKIMVIFLIGLPFWIVLCAFIYNKKLYALPAQYFNQAFRGVEYIPVPVKARRVGDAIPVRNVVLVSILGCLSLGVWFFSYDFSSDAGPLFVTKAQAIKVAADAIQKEFGVDVISDWQPICIVHDDGTSSASRFIWQVYGKDAYQKFQGSYIEGASWGVRFVQFHRPVEDRGEEYIVIVSNCCRVGATLPEDMNPKVLGIEHKLLEHYLGADISEQDALQIAYELIEKKFGLTAQEISLISVASDKFENRRDWNIVVQDCSCFNFDKEGQARIHLTISGDVVTQYSRFIFVPEDWSRADKLFLMNLDMFKTILYFVMVLFIMFGLIFGVRKLLVSQYGTQMMQHKGLLVFALVVIVAINNFCIHIGYFNTTEPYNDQFVRQMLQLILQNTYQVFFCSLFLAVGAVGFIKGHKPKYIRSILLGLASGSLIAGVVSFLGQYECLLQPRSGNFVLAGSWFPAIAFCCFMIKTFCFLLSFIIAMFVVLKAVQRKWPYQIWLQLLCTILFCLSLQAMSATESIVFIGMKGLILGVVVYGLYWFILQYDMTILPFVLAAVVIFDVAPELVCPSYVGSQFHAVYAIILMIAVALFFYERAHIE